MRGIYTLANDNDRVIEDTLAFLNSLFTYEQNCPVMLIPFNDEYHKIASIVGKKYDVQIYDNKDILRALDLCSKEIFGKETHMMRKFACWFGPFDEFIYFDTDIVVLKDQKDTFDLLNEYDMVRDGSIRKLGIRSVFKERIFERNLFPKHEINELFNAGFFASKKGVIGYDQLMSILKEAVDVSDIFDHVGDQPLLNYVMLRAIPRRANLRLLKPDSIDAWAGVKGMKVKGGRIYETDGRPVRYVHWAGLKPVAMRPYVSLWLKYRYPERKWVFKRVILNIYYSVLQIKVGLKSKLRTILKRILMKFFPKLFTATT